MLKCALCGDQAQKGAGEKPAAIGNGSQGELLTEGLFLLRTLQNWVLNAGYSGLTPSLRIRAIFNLACQDGNFQE